MLLDMLMQMCMHEPCMSYQLQDLKLDPYDSVKLRIPRIAT